MKNVEQLWLTLNEIWMNIDSDTIKELVDFMPNRILDVQKSRGPYFHHIEFLYGILVALYMHVIVSCTQ